MELFAGVAGFGLGLEQAGFRCVGQVEIDAACQRILAVRFPGVWRAEDVRGLWTGLVGRAGADAAGGGGEPPFAPEHVDLLVGGFPCQDLSVAGKRAGLGGERSGLFYEIVRIAKTLKPTWGLFENVPGLFSSAGGRDMGLVLAGLRECWPAVGYRVLDSRYFGVAQRRRRVFFVCGPDEARVAQVLFESAGGRRDLAASGEAGAGVAASLTAGAHRAGVNEPGRRHEDDVNLVVAAQCHGNNIGPMGTLREGDGGLTSGVPFVAHALTGEGHDAGEDGTGRGVPMVASPLTADLR